MTTQQADQPWRDPALPVAERVAALLARMTIEEKVAQLGSRWVGNDMQETGAEDRPEPEETLNVAPMQDVFAASGTVPLRRPSRQSAHHCINSARCCV